MLVSQNLGRRLVDESDTIMGIDDQDAFAQVLHDVLRQLRHVGKIEVPAAYQGLAFTQPVRHRPHGERHTEQYRTEEAGCQIVSGGSRIADTDEYLLHPDPYETVAQWCHARIEYTQRRLDSSDSTQPIVFVTHYPLVRDPTRVLRYPLFAQWCGTTATADWHRRYHAAAVVYGHLHIPRTTWSDGVPFTEVSLGYPREWRRRPNKPQVPKNIELRSRP